MDEKQMMELLKILVEKVDKIENTLEELKSSSYSKDNTNVLKNEKGVEIDKWLDDIEITSKNIRILLEEKNYTHLLESLNCNKCLKVVNNKKISVYYYSNESWKTLTKPKIEYFQNRLFNKIHKQYLAMKDEKNSELNRESIKSLTYIEQREILNLVTTTPHNKFKRDLYDVLKDCKAS